MRLQSLAGGIEQSWTALYTLGLPEELKLRRRGEVASDLWEHRSWAARTALSDTGVAAQIVLRTALGLPADLTWRLGHARWFGLPVELQAAMGSRASWASRLSHGYLLLLAVLSLAFIPVTVGYNGWSGAVWVAGAALGALAVFVGLRFAARRRWTAAPLILFGAVPPVLAWSWVVAPSLLVLPVVVYGLVRVRRH